jgi:hypothetical protein
MDNQVRERFYYPKGFVSKNDTPEDERRRIDYSKIHRL